MRSGQFLLIAAALVVAASFFANTFSAVDFPRGQGLRSFGGRLFGGGITGLSIGDSAGGDDNHTVFRERAAGNVEGIVGNIMQSFGGQGLYPRGGGKTAHPPFFFV